MRLAGAATEGERIGALLGPLSTLHYREDLIKAAPTVGILNQLLSCLLLLPARALIEGAGI